MLSDNAGNDYQRDIISAHETSRKRHSNDGRSSRQQSPQLHQTDGSVPITNNPNSDLNPQNDHENMYRKYHASSASDGPDASSGRGREGKYGRGRGRGYDRSRGRNRGRDYDRSAGPLSEDARGPGGKFRKSSGRISIPLASFLEPTAFTDENVSLDQSSTASSSNVTPSDSQSKELPSKSQNTDRLSTMKQLSILDLELSIALDGLSAPRPPSHSDISSSWAYMDETDVSDFDALLPEPAMRFPFPLDDFQKRAVLAVDQGRSVFVAAHTSAGKTVIAEYAVALADSMGGKAIYTSPIKSLSNQKLRDFRGKFEDVGLVTGDVSINETAQCVIMTTEILRSMLYKGADMIRDVRFVIFDEVQFLNDEERGVVWEETIIMLPPHIGIIMLSATVPNAIEFSDWVGRTKNRPVSVVLTNRRPVPLKHHILFRLPSDPEGLHTALLLEQGGAFLEKNYRQTLSAVQSQKRDAKERKKRDKRSTKKRLFGSEFDMPDGENVTELLEEDILDVTLPVMPDAIHTPVSIAQDGEESNPMNITDGNAAVEPHVSCNTSDTYKREGGTSLGFGNEPNKELSGNFRAKSSGLLAKEESSKQGGHDDRNSEKTEKRFIKGLNRSKGPSAKSAIANATGSSTGSGLNRPSPWKPLVQHLTKEKMDPAIVFCFSKKKCEMAVDSLENCDLLPDSSHKAYVHRFFENAISRLHAEDQSLPQVTRVVQNLKRGIAAHHAGLLPLVKEITEILFSEGYVKILFATETFAMGVNMPARAVVFVSVEKFDGRRKRFLEAGEYTQMSGRAGRRGIDEVGHVFLFFPPDERLPDLASLKRIMTARPFSLKSAFRLTYNMILNVLRVDELRVEEVMKRSFSEAGEGSKSERIGGVLRKVDDKLNELNLSDDDSDGGSILNGERWARSQRRETRLHWDRFLSLYGELLNEGSKLTFREVNPLLRAFLYPGRVVVAQLEPGRLCLGSVFTIVPPKWGRRQDWGSWLSVKSIVWLAVVEGITTRLAAHHSPSVLLMPVAGESNYRRQENWSEAPTVVTYGGLVISLKQVTAADILFMIDEVEEISQEREERQGREAFLWHSRKEDRARHSLILSGKFLEKVIWKWSRLKAEGGQAKFFKAASAKGRPPVIAKSFTSRAMLAIQLAEDVEIARAMNKLRGTCALHKAGLVLMKEQVQKKIEQLQQVQTTGQQPSLLPEYNNRVRVLQELSYVGDDGVSVNLKGRCACEVATADCVVLTEVVFENVLNGLSVAEVASLLSSLVCRKKNEADVHKLDEQLYSSQYREAKAKMREVVIRVGEIQERLGVELDFDIADGRKGYEDSMCRWDLANAVYAWASGKPFFEITSLTEQQEGDIVVCVKRLCELVRDTQSVANGIGNEELVNVLENVITAIKRDVIFNGSLYYE